LRQETIDMRFETMSIPIPELLNTVKIIFFAVICVR